MRGAGRTDAGVHATGQVAHVDLARDWPAKTVRDAVNAHLSVAGATVAILAVARRRRGISTRDSRRLRRHYLYRIIDRRAPLTLDTSPRLVGAQAARRRGDAGGGQRLLGRHDFTTFRSRQCQAASPVRTLDRLDVARSGETIDIRASARSFLHNQVRSMVGR